MKIEELSKYKNTAIYDGDGIAYIVAWLCKDASSIEELFRTVDSYLINVFKSAKCDSYIGLLKDKNTTNFRQNVAKYAKYKGTRDKTLLHESYYTWGDAINDYLVSAWKFNWVTNDNEVDDEVAYIVHLNNTVNGVCESTDSNCNRCTVVHYDKDLNQIPDCWHLFSNRKEKKWMNYYVDKFGTIEENITYKTSEKTGKQVQDKKTYSGTGLKFLAWQMLTGDKVDNIIGVKDIHEGEAYELIKDCKSIRELRVTVIRAYYDWICTKNRKKKYTNGQSYANALIQENYTLLSMLQYERNNPEQLEEYAIIPFEVSNFKLKTTVIEDVF